MNVGWIVAGVMLATAIAAFVLSLRLSRKLTFAEDAKLSEYLLGSGLAGLAVGLLFGTLALGMSAFHPEYKWNSSGLIASIAPGLMICLLVALGSLWQYYAVGKFRDALYRRLRKKRSH